MQSNPRLEPTEAALADLAPSPSYEQAELSPPMAVNDAQLQDALKRCSPDTLLAAFAFRKSGELRHIPAIVRGVILRYTDKEQRVKLSDSATTEDTLRLSEDLGIDSLTMMEIVLLAEDVFPITIHNEELCGLKTVGDINRFILTKLQPVRV